MLVVGLGQNDANMALAIPCEAQNTSLCRRSAQCRRRNVAQMTHEGREPTPEAPYTESTRDLVLNRLERLETNPNLEDD